MIPAALYSRRSPRPEDKAEDAAEIQRRWHEATIAEWTEYARKEGYQIVSTHLESETSGRMEDPDELYATRPKLLEAIQSLKPGMVLAITKRDRIIRSVLGQGMVTMDVARRGCRVIASAEPNGDLPEDRFRQQIMASVSELERALIAARTKAKMRAYQKAGRRMGRADRVPFGLKADPASAPNKRGNPATMVPDEAELHIIRIIQELAAEGLGVRAICTRLDKAGFARRGKTWRSGASTVVAILKRNEVPA